ncbi:MAG TPA: hypothetical protein DCS66_15355 [Flavobacteriaceae bacterium]|nr:hypothetical protein [Flavobacteriaceae bacterium]|tara:strand:+ start:219 stop:407 length:189 start_codon:yes stop_codon:yes gene_type:complete
MVKKVTVKLEDQAEDFIKNYIRGQPRNFLPETEIETKEKKKKVTKKKLFHSLLRLGKKEVPK